jgi:hypothetical protein
MKDVLEINLLAGDRVCDTLLDIDFATKSKNQPLIFSSAVHHKGMVQGEDLACPS